MKNYDGLNLVGIITVKLFNKNGRLKAKRRVKNMIVNTGRAMIIDRLQAGTPAIADYIAIGTGVTAAAAADTTMQTEVARSQSNPAVSQPDAYTDRAQFTFPAGTGTGNIAEAGRLNAAAAGVLFARQTFTAVNKTATDSLQITYDITYAAS
jgi:hypothetical protein